MIKYKFPSYYICTYTLIVKTDLFTFPPKKERGSEI